MHVGIDFDNTIVGYDELFFRVASEDGLIDSSVQRSKNAVRDFLQSQPDGNKSWTELQGKVYGLRMEDALLNPGVMQFLSFCREENVVVSIVSHKMQYPALGPKYDMIKAAGKWLRDHDFLTGIIAEENVYFEPTRDDKIRRIDSSGCSHFIDDLKEVFENPLFPAGVKKFLYAPQLTETDTIDAGNWFDAIAWIRKDLP